MNREDFLQQLGLSVLAFATSSIIAACNKDDDNPSPSGGSGGGATTVDFTLDLNDPANNALNTNGGFFYTNGIIVVRTNSGAYIALDSICTHAGCTVQYDSSGNNFPCPCHGSLFSSSGSILSGPATTSLQKYNTTLNGSLLRVFS